MVEVTDDKVVIHLLISLKGIVIGVDPVLSFQNMSHSTRFFFCEKIS